MLQSRLEGRYVSARGPLGQSTPGGA